MINSHLQNQFERIYVHFSCKTADTTIQDVADILCCTTRNARNVINKMIEQGWLNWQPTVGRGNKSLLHFHCSIEDIQTKRAEYLFQQGKLSLALEELNSDKKTLFQMLAKCLGSTNAKGIVSLKLAYFRSKFCVEPKYPHDKIESFLTSLIFEGLTRFNASTDKVESAIAHRWQKITLTHWRFFIRNNIFFHDETKLVEKNIIDCLSAIKHLPLFEHIQSLHSPCEGVIDIHLFRPDEYLPNLLSMQKASIYKSPEGNVLGTGPYCLMKNSSKGIYLKKSSRFQRADFLIDEIKVDLYNKDSVDIDINELDLNLNSNLSVQLNNLCNEDVEIIENGCIFILLNRVTGAAKNKNIALFLTKICSSIKNLSSLNQSNDLYKLIPAWGLLLGWQHCSNDTANKDIFTLTKLTLAYPKNHALLYHLALLLKDAFAKYNIDLDLKEQSVKAMHSLKGSEKIDIWLNHFELEKNHSLISWLFEYQHLEKAMPDEEIKNYKKLYQEQYGNRNSRHSFENLGKQLVLKRQLIPLFHLLKTKSDFSSFITNKSAEEILTLLWTAPLVD